MKENDQPLNTRAIQERYLSVMEQISLAERLHGREPGAVKLIAVTKTFTAESILSVLQIHSSFGENRVQEAMQKWPALRERFPDTKLHLIGPLQTNKVREAVGLFDCIQTLDRPKLAAALAAEIQKQGKAPQLLIQVNTGLEPQKAGVTPDGAPEFVQRCQREFGLAVSGLMCIPPLKDDPLPHFETLAALRDRLPLRELSMGMSGDFEIAIATGATMVRVGSAIFGTRASG
jgi:PLP dependent protein